MKLYNTIKAASKKMQIDFEEITSQIEHRPTKGDFREDIIKEFLRQYLPENFGICKGLVIDAEGVQSKQQDILIYDKATTPKFLVGDADNVLPIESIVATIEVKSVLNKTELLKALENLESTRSLTKKFLNKKVKSPIPFGFIFAFTSQITLEQVRKSYRDFFAKTQKTQLPSAIILLDRGSLLHFSKDDLNIIEINPDNNSTFGIKEAKEKGDNLMMFYILLTASIFYEKSWQVNFPDIAFYAQKSGFINPSTSISKEESTNTKVILDNMVIDVGKMQEATKYFSGTLEDSATRQLKMLEIINDATNGKLFEGLIEQAKKRLKELGLEGETEQK